MGRRTTRKPRIGGSARTRHLHQRPAHELRRDRGRARHRPRGRPRARSSPSSAPTARARRPRSRSSRATGNRTGGEVRVLGEDPASTRARLARPDRHRPAVEQPRSLPDRARVARALRRVLQPPALGRGDDRPDRPRGEGRRTGAQALRRPAAPPRRRHGAGRRPRAALPRRADDRLRPLRPAPVLGRDRGPARPRQDDLPHHPLHGRGAAARRPGDDHRGRPDRRRGHPRGPRRTRKGDGDDPLPRRGGRGGLDRDLRPGAGAATA